MHCLTSQTSSRQQNGDQRVNFKAPYALFESHRRERGESKTRSIELKCSLSVSLFSFPYFSHPSVVSPTLPLQTNSEFKRRLKAIETAKKKAEKKVRKKKKKERENMRGRRCFSFQSTSTSLLSL